MSYGTTISATAISAAGRLDDRGGGVNGLWLAAPARFPNAIGETQSITEFPTRAIGPKIEQAPGDRPAPFSEWHDGDQ